MVVKISELKRKNILRKVLQSKLMLEELINDDKKIEPKYYSHKREKYLWESSVLLSEVKSLLCGERINKHIYYKNKKGFKKKNE